MSCFHTNSNILLLSSSFTTREPKFVFIFNFFLFSVVFSFESHLPYSAALKYSTLMVAAISPSSTPTYISLGSQENVEI